jgi:hypothetical protein
VGRSIHHRYVCEVGLRAAAAMLAEWNERRLDECTRYADAALATGQLAVSRAHACNSVRGQQAERGRPCSPPIG